MWSRTRPELFFQSAFNNVPIMVASYATTPDSFGAQKAQVWSPGRFLQRQRLRAVNIHPDGQRFAIAPVPDVAAAANQNKVVFVFNFFDELKRLAPAK